jgi:hypothetical protein
MTPADRPTKAALSFKNRRRADNLELMGAPLPLEVAKPYFPAGEYTSGRITSENDTAAQAFASQHSPIGLDRAVARSVSRQGTDLSVPQLPENQCGFNRAKKAPRTKGFNP